MIAICLLSLLINGLNGQGCSDDSIPNCQDRVPPGGDWACCYADGDSCVPTFNAIDCVITNDDDTATTTEPVSTASAMSTTEIDCDNTDLSEWRIDYIGQSTQFRIYDPCDNKFIKFKMEDLTEYNGQTDKKTNNKETSFASAKDWEWGTNSGVDATFQGNDAILNIFNASQLTNGESSFTLNTWFFMDPTEITDPDNTNDTITILKNTLKFDTIIENWPYLDDDNYLVLCIGVMTNKAGDIDDDPDTKTYYLQEFEIYNVETAVCEDENGDTTHINVTIDRDGNGNNHLDLCYTFDSCQGTIRYDPIISVGGSDSDSAAFQLNQFIAACFIAFAAVFSN